MHNLQDYNRLRSLQTSIANKSKSQSTLNDSPERKIQALERNVNKIKLNTQKDKTKITKVDTNEQERFNSKISTAHVTSATLKCGQCETIEAKMKCLECLENYCANCFAQIHLRGALQRHRRILLHENESSTLPNKRQSVHTDVQKKDLLQRKSPMSSNANESDEKTLLRAYQQSFLQWRENNLVKSQRIRAKRELINASNESIIEQTKSSTKLPNIDSNSSKTSTKKTSLSKLNQPKKAISGKRDQLRPNVLITIIHTSSDNISINDSNFDAKENIPNTNRDDSVIDSTYSSNVNNLENTEQHERPGTHSSRISLSRPTSSLKDKQTTNSRPTSTAIGRQSLHTQLATKSNDELQEIIDTNIALSRASSSIIEKNQHPLILHDQNWHPEKSLPHNINAEQTTIDKYSIIQFNNPPDDFFDESKIELSLKVNNLHDYNPRSTSEQEKCSTNTCLLNSTSTTPRRSSPFTFTYSLHRRNRMNSSSSRDTGDGGFFTDLLPRQSVPPPNPPPPAIFECSTSNEWKNTSDNQRVLVVSRSASKRSLIIDENRRRSKSQFDNYSRPESSASLPVSISLLKSNGANQNDQSSRRQSISTALSNRSSTITPTTEASSSSSTIKDTPSPKESQTNHRNEQSFVKEIHHFAHTASNDEPAKLRKLGFCIGNGPKWQEASFESIDSKSVKSFKESSVPQTARSLPPSNSRNTKLCQEYSIYDKDDGRSSPTFQNVNDEEYFSRLHQELNSALDTMGPDEDALINDHILNMRRNIQYPSIETVESMDNKLPVVE